MQRPRASGGNDTNVKGNSTNLQSSPAKPLFSCDADRPELALLQADRPRSSLARTTAKRTASRRPCPPIKAGGSRPSPRPSVERAPRTLRISHVSDWPEMSKQIASCCRARLRGGNSAIRDLATHHACEVRWPVVQRVRPVANWSKQGQALKSNTANFRIARPIPFDIARVPTYD